MGGPLPDMAGKLLFLPGRCNTRKYYNCYSSTNYVLLGLLLAAKSGASSWDGYKQMSGIQPAATQFAKLDFAVTGSPADFTKVHGYDTTHYNHNNKSYGHVVKPALCRIYASCND